MILIIKLLTRRRLVKNSVISDWTLNFASESEIKKHVVKVLAANSASPYAVQVWSRKAC